MFATTFTNSRFGTLHNISTTTIYYTKGKELKNDHRRSLIVYSSLVNIVAVLPFIHGYNARRICYIGQLTLRPWPATHRQQFRLLHTLLFR